MGTDGVVQVQASGRLIFADKKQAATAAKAVKKAAPGLSTAQDGASLSLSLDAALALPAWAALTTAAWEVAERAASGQVEVAIPALGDARRLRAGGRVEQVIVEQPEGALARLGSYRLRSLAGVTAGITTLSSKKSPSAELGVCAAFSPDGKRVAVGSTGTGSGDHLDGLLGGGDVRLWDVESGELLGTYLGLGYTHRIQSLAFSPDGGRLACGVWGNNRGKYYGEVFLLDLVEGRLIASKRVHKREVYQVAFSPDGEVFASVGADLTPMLWNGATGALLATLSGHTTEPSSVVFLPDGRTLLSLSTDGTMRRWDARTGASLGHVAAGPAVRAELLPGGEVLACIESERLVLRSVSTGHEVAGGRFPEKGGNFAGYNVESVSAAGTDEHPVLAITRYPERNDADLWDARRGERLQALPGVAYPVLSRDGSLAAGARGNAVALVDLTGRGSVVQAPGHTIAVSHVALSPDGAWVVSSSYDGELWAWDLARNQRRRERLPLASGSLLAAMAFSPDGKRVTLLSKQELVLWDHAAGRGDSIAVGGASLAFSPDGAEIYVGGEGSVSVVDRERGAVARRWEGPKAEWLARSPDGRLVASSGGSEIVIFDSKTGQKLAEHKGGGYDARIGFSHDGSSLHAFDYGPRLSAVKVSDGTEGAPRVFSSPEHPSVRLLALSPDGRRIAGAMQGALLVWDIASGQRLLVGRGHRQPIGKAAFSADGRRVVSADSTLLVWELG